MCSGIESVSVAWNPFGWEAAWLAEIDPFCNAVLQHHYPEVENLGDIHDVGASAGAIDLLVGGTPCQSFSVAGLRAGMDDPRGNLALEFLRVADRTRPRWVVWENVPGVLSSNNGRDFGAIVGALGELRYGWAYRVLDAQYFGVPQRRRRVFVVGHLGDWHRAAAVLFERQSLSGHPAPGRETGQGAAGTLKGGTGSRGWPDPSDGNGGGLVAGTLGGGTGSRGWCDDTDRMTFVPETAYGLHTHHPRDADRTTFIVNARQDPITSDQAQPLDSDGHSQAIAFDVAQMTSKANRTDFRPGREASPLNGSARHHVAFQQNSRSEVRLIGGDGQSVGSVTADPGAQQQNYIAGHVVRGLTPEECESLQGFSRGYTQVSYRGKPAADGPRYRALGNAMAVPVMRWIGERIQMVEEA